MSRLRGNNPSGARKPRAEPSDHRVVSIAEWQKTRQERAEALQRAERHLARAEYCEAAWNFIAANEPKRAMECAKRLRWRRQFTSAAEICEKLGETREQADILYETGYFFRAAQLYLKLYEEEPAHPKRDPFLLEKIFECAERLVLLDNPVANQEAVAIAEMFEQRRMWVSAAQLYKKLNMPEKEAQCCGAGGEPWEAIRLHEEMGRDTDIVRIATRSFSLEIRFKAAGILYARGKKEEAADLLFAVAVSSSILPLNEADAQPCSCHTIGACPLGVLESDIKSRIPLVQRAAEIYEEIGRNEKAGVARTAVRGMEAAYARIDRIHLEMRTRHRQDEIDAYNYEARCGVGGDE